MNSLYYLVILLLVSSVTYAQTPAAEFVTESYSICYIEGQQSEIVISLTGDAPFTIQYMIESESNTVIYTSDSFYPDIDNQYTFLHTLAETSTITMLQIWDATNTGETQGATIENQNIIVTVDHKPTISAGADDEICGVSYTLQGTTDIASSTYLWSSTYGSFDDETSLTPVFSTDASTTINSYTLTLTAENGACKDDNAVSDEVKITLKGNPTGTITEGDENFCAPQNLPVAIQFVGNGNYSYQLTDTDNNTFARTSTSNTTTTEIENVNKTTSYQLSSILDNTTDCYAQASGMTGIKNYINELPETYAGEDVIICGEDKSYTLQGSSNEGTTGTWTIANGDNLLFSDNTNSNTTITSGIYQTATLTWTETTTNLGCKNSDDVVVLFSEDPSLNIGTTEDKICESDGIDLTLTATGNAPWTVNYSYAGKTYTEEVTTSSHIIQLLGTNQAIGDNVYSFTKIEGNNGCITAYGDLTYNLSVDELPYPNAGTDDEVCSKEITLNAVPSGIGTGYWQGPGTFEDNSDPYTTFVSNDFGVQTLSWVEENGQCKISDEVDINFQRSPYPFGAGNDTLIYATDTLSLNAKTLTSGIGTWSVTSGTVKIDDINNPQALVYNLKEGTHNLLWTATIDESVCEDLSEEITIIKKNLFAPTGFSPGGNGYNDLFKILGADNISNNKLSVFDKNGKLVYSTQNYQNDWTGNSNAGSKLPAGVYYYVFEGDQLIKPVKNYLIIKYDN